MTILSHFYLITQLLFDDILRIAEPQARPISKTELIILVIAESNVPDIDPAFIFLHSTSFKIIDDILMD